jgi:phenylpropionate dioxygenase-like ring-hydroxylating dioxygenase large terminal subunit
VVSLYCVVVGEGAVSVRDAADLAMSDLPIPWGWFAVGFSHELPRRRVLTRRLAGEELVVWRGADGSLGATSSTCPHLGAHLGRGCVDGDAIRCAFHGFMFDGAGRCVASHGASPPRAGLAVRSWPVRERNGVLLVWHHPHRSAPSFEVPELEAVPMTPLGRTTTACLEFDGHPAATSENSVDIAHLAEVHHYTDVVMARPFEAEGTEASASYAMTRPVGIPGDGRLPALRRAAARVRFDVRLFGLGVSVVEASIPRIGARTRQQVLATPVAPGRIEFRLTMQVLHDGGRLRTIAELVAARIATYGFLHDVHQDIPIWASQRYVSRPALAHGDGPIVPYRRWARQFLEHDG